MNVGMPLNVTWKTDAKRRDAILRDATFTAAGPKDAIVNDAGKPTPSVATPPKDAIFSIGELRDAFDHEV
jgi:hypothetical protein